MIDSLSSLLLPEEAAQNYSYDIVGSRFPHPLSLYRHLPDLDALPIADFEEAAVQRLRILNFLHESFGAETSVSPSVLRKGSATTRASGAAAAATANGGGGGLGGGLQRRSSAGAATAGKGGGGDLTEAAVAGAAAGAGGGGGGVERDGQQDSAVRQLKKLLQESGLMLPEAGTLIGSSSSRRCSSSSNSSSRSSSGWAFTGKGAGGGQGGSCNGVRLSKAATAAETSAAAAAEQERRREVALRDAVSHFALRLGFCVSWERQQWFIRQESRLFLFRLEELLQLHRTEWQTTSSGSSSGGGFFGEKKGIFDVFLAREGLHYDFVTRPTRGGESAAATIWRRATEFRADALHANGFSYSEYRLFLVPFFPDAASLVARRRVYIHKSIAYVPLADMDHVLLSQFRNVLQENFRLLEARQTTLQSTVFQDPRVGELLTALPTAYVGKDFRTQTTDAAEDRLTPEILKDVWRTSFPPCMRRLFGAYLREHHLRHSGRLQLWLFFKGAGLRMEENLSVNRSLWQDAQKFDREHAYTIRHIYGHEGKRADYPPLSCSKIISGSGMLQTPGVGDYHGCPFKHFDKPQLQKLLASFDLSANQIASIMKFEVAKDYQLACKEFFVQTHPGNEGDGVGNHPNHFYEASRRHHRKKLSAATVTSSDASPDTSSSSGRDSKYSGKSRSYGSSDAAVAYAAVNGYDAAVDAQQLTSRGLSGRDGVES